MDFATSYDILQHTKGDFYENLQSKKWNERKEAIGGLVDIMNKNPRLSIDDSTKLHRLITELNKILKQDSNINVAAVTAAALTRLARGLGSDFRPFATTILLTSLNRLKEVKPVLRDPCIECLDACYATTSFDAVLPCIKEGLSMKAPGSKLQTCEFFTRIMLKLDLQTARKSAAATKEIVEVLCKMALGSDATCREGAMKSLAAFLKAVGKQAGMPLIAPVVEDKLKMAKVDEYFEQFASEVPQETLQSTNDLPTESEKLDDPNVVVSEKKLSELGKLRVAILMNQFLSPYDILKHTNEDLYNEMQSKKWNERKDAIGKLVDIMDKNAQLTTDNVAGYQRLIGQLIKILKEDSNINVAATAVMALTRLARGLGVAFQPYSSDVIFMCLTRLKEVKPTLRDPCIECLNFSYLSSTFDFTLPCITKGLAMKAPGSKLQTCEFFTRIMLDIDFETTKKSAPATKEVVEELCKLALGGDANCRDAAMKSLAAFLRAVGKQAGASLLSSVAEDKLKMAKVDEYYDQYIKDFPPDPVTKPEATQPPPKSANAATKRPTSTTTRSSALVQNRPKTQPIKPQIVRTEAPTLREQNGVTPARRPSAPIRPAAKPVAVVPKTLAAIGKPNHQPSARGKIESTETSRPVPKTIRRSEGPTLLQQRRMDSAPRISTIRPTPTRTLSAYRMSVDDPRRRDQSNRASTANASQTPSRRPTSVTRPISANVVNRPAPIKPNIVRMPTKPTETLKLTSTASESNRQTNGNSQQISQGGDVQQNEPARIRSALPAPRRSMLPTPSASIRPTNSQTKI